MSEPLFLRNDEIRRLASQGMSQVALGRKFGVSASRIGSILNGPRECANKRDGIHHTVYFVRCGGFVKIGVTTKIGPRIVNLQHQTPYPVTLVGVLKGGRVLEAELHRRFAADRHHGEWFKETQDLTDFLNDQFHT